MDSSKKTKETNEFTLNPKENDSELISAFLSEVIKRYPHLLKLRYSDTIRAMEILKETLDEPFSVIVRDATIQRFEYTFESLWKFLRSFMKRCATIIY